MLNLRVVALGHRMPRWVVDGWSEYAGRLPRDVTLELVELKPEPRDRGRPIAEILAAEAKRVGPACDGAARVALDEHGRPWTSRAFADQLARWRDDARAVAFIIGSADGIDPVFKRDATALFALSALTLPHGLVRVLLAEQIYRAATLLAGHPYHRD
jgi:23S rRNA (pseudouridine1915-N3)-methyltransferase